MELEDSNLNIDISTLPSQLVGDDDFPLPVFDSRQVPWSPTSLSPGKRSPGRPRTMKEYEEDLATLKKENFNLKVRIYFLEQHRVDPSLPRDADELRHLYTTLKVEHDLQKKDLEAKESLLLDTYKALDAQKQQLEEVTEERRELRCRLEGLEKELKEWQQRLMDTSVPLLDDTNALYTVTFGLNNKPQPDNHAEDKIKELEEELSKEKERALMLEGQISILNDKSAEDKRNMEKLVVQIENMEDQLSKILEERNRYEQLYANTSEFSAKVERSLKKKLDVITDKEKEVEKWKLLAEELRKQLTKVENQLQKEAQEKEKLKHEKTKVENQLQKEAQEKEKLKHEVRYRQHLAGSAGGGSSSAREREEAEILRMQCSQAKVVIQSLLREKKQLTAKLNRAGASVEQTKEEVKRIVDGEKEMSTDKNNLIFELQAKIEELAREKTLKELKELRDKLDSLPSSTKSKCDSIQQFPEDGVTQEDRDYEILQKDLQEKNKEIESLKKELRKKTFNLQGLVNKELWDKNREIEKLNKLCERQHVEMMSLEKQLRDSQLTTIQEMRGVFEDKENLQPITDARGQTAQTQRLTEEKRQLQRKVEELQARLLNTPERDKESEQLQQLREEREAADRQRKEAVNACVLLTTRLRELADFLECLLPLLCGKRRRYVQQAVERSRELSRSLSLAAEESSLLQCSTWTDLQPSLVVPLLPDISTVDFWSGDEAEEPFSAEEDATKPPASDNPFLDSIFNFDGKNFSIGNKTEDIYENLADVTEGSLVESGSERCTKVTPVKSANIGNITLTSKKKEARVEGDVSKPKEDGLSECETWSEPDRDVSYARMGLKEDLVMNKSTQFGGDDTSETADSVPKSPLSRRGSEIQRLQRKVRSLEQVNAALRSELVILHQVAPPALTRQDKATSVELSRQNSFSVPAHLLDEIRNQREKLEASLFHNDYIRRQLEGTALSLQRSQGEPDKTLIARLKEVTSQLEASETEATELKKEKENLNSKVEFLHKSLQNTSDELKEKQLALEKLELETSQRINEINEKYSSVLSQSEQKCLELERKSGELEKQNSELTQKIAELNGEIINLKKEIEDYLLEGKKNKQLNDELNMKLQQISRQKDELERLTSEQDQLLADAERERQELATQLIARDREVSELSKRLSNMELTSSELEAALRSQLELATQQCAQFESRIRELDCCNKMAQVERMKAELERRVAELESVNTELETKLASLNIRPPMSDYDSDSPRRPRPPPLTLARPTPAASPARSHDLTSDYLSDQEAAVASPQGQSRGLWGPSSPHRHPYASASPDLGIESDHGRFSSLDSHPPTTAVSLRGTPVKDLMKLEEENTQLRLNLQKTRHALEETLAQLTAANQHKRQYEAQLSAAYQHKAKVERAICRQLHKTHSILKKARVNLEEDGKKE